ncbi:MAG: DEAD/DEAH box helicase family protein, partial [Candidatus Hydrogenedentes bacterium]|nr:DEAD/DEAH box helicase family protein [Candidatus Hydrogenedentota bacterium]
MPSTHVERIVAEASRRGQVLGIRLSADDDAEGIDPWRFPPSRRRGERPLQEPLPQTIRVLIGNQLYLQKDGLSAQLMNQLIRLAAFQNPEFYRAQKMRLSTFGKPRVVACAEDFPKHIALPRGCLDDLKSFLTSNGIGLTIHDERYGGVPCEFRFQGQLESEQMKAVQEILEFDNGVLVAPTGFGKTVVAARIIAERRSNTLVLVHRKSLLDQWRERLATFLGLTFKEIGTFSSERRKPGGVIDVASLQSLSRKGEVNDLVADYGHVIIDECHHIPAFTFERVLKEAKAKYVLGLTATPIRKDGFHPIIMMQCGPIRARIRAQDTGRFRPFRQIALLRKTDFELPEGNNEPTIHDVYAAIINDSKRNALILRDIADAVADGRCPLVLTERTAHLEYLAAEIAKTGCHVVVLRGGMGKKQREAAYKQLESIPKHEQRVVLATGRYAGEGFDDPRL